MKKMTDFKPFSGVFLMLVMLLVVVFSSSFGSAALEDDLLYYWTLNESSGTIQAVYGTNNGSYNGALYAQTGKIGTSIGFDASNDIIDFDTTFSLDSSASSMSMWFYSGGFGRMLAGNSATSNNYLWAKSDTTTMELYIDATPLLFTVPAMSTSTWYFLTITRDSGTTRLYLNGVESSTGGQVDAHTWSLDVLGKYNVGLYYNGRIDEVAVWERALSESEIGELYNSGDGLTYADFPNEIGPSVALVSPANDSNPKKYLMEFEAVVTDDQYVENVSLYIDGVLTITDTNHTNGTYTFSVDLDEGVHNWSILAADNASLFNQSPTWTFNYTKIPYYFIENEVVYPPTSLELSPAVFSYNFTYDPTDWSSTTVILSYNGTNYTTTNYTGTDTRYYTEILSVPSVTGIVNYEFEWLVRLTNATGVYVYDSANYNHTVTDIILYNCSVASYPVFNLTLKDEETGDLLLGTIETSIELYSQDSPDNTISFSYNASNVSNWAICSNVSLANQSLVVNGKWKYYADGYEIEYYNIRNWIANSTTLGQNLSFYDLNSTAATRFQIKFVGDNFLPVANALIVVSREFVSEGAFKTVEIPITDTDGMTTAALVKDTAVYTFYIYSEGELLATFQNVIPVCENELTEECNINLNAASTTTGVDDFSESDDMNHIVTYDDVTREIELSYSTFSGASADVDMIVMLSDGYDNDTICSETVSSSSGTLSCIVPASYINKTVSVSIYKDDTYLSGYSIGLYPKPSDTFGLSGYFMAFVLIVMIPFMFVTNVIGVVIGLMIGVIITSMLLLGGGASLTTIGGALAWFLVACGALIYQLNRNGAG